MTWPRGLHPVAAAEGKSSWVEVDGHALADNVRALRAAASRGGPSRPLVVMVKGNAYGHGLLEAARAFVAAQVRWLGVGEVDDARRLRQAGIDATLLNVCPTPAAHIDAAVGLGMSMTVYDAETVQVAAAAARRHGKRAELHLKVETGTWRQGLLPQDAARLADEVYAASDALVLRGVHTHYADIEDTTDHRFARTQLETFEAARAAIEARVPAGVSPPLFHASNSAALLLWPEACGALLRCGISAYGYWPSRETLVAVRDRGHGEVSLRPALTWKTVVAQAKAAPRGAWVGYGRTVRLRRSTRLAILPVGYHDGYDRALSGVAEVLVRGQRAPVLGRVAMNMIAIDVTDIAPADEPVLAGEEVVLLGAQPTASGGADPGDGAEPGGGAEPITAEEMARWASTIHYEVITRIAARLPRVVVS